MAIATNMSWILATIISLCFYAISDLFRKLSSQQISIPAFANLMFQTGSILSAISVFILSDRKMIANPQGIIFAILGGFLVSLATVFSFRALIAGPGLSVVMPAIRIGSVALVAILGILVLKEKLSTQTFFGLIFSAVGIYLLFSNK